MEYTIPSRLTTLEETFENKLFSVVYTGETSAYSSFFEYDFFLPDYVLIEIHFKKSRIFQDYKIEGSGFEFNEFISSIQKQISGNILPDNLKDLIKSFVTDIHEQNNDVAIGTSVANNSSALEVSLEYGYHDVPIVSVRLESDTQRYKVVCEFKPGVKVDCNALLNSIAVSISEKFNFKNQKVSKVEFAEFVMIDVLNLVGKIYF